MDNKLLEQLYVAQVLTLAKTLHIEFMVKGKASGTTANFEDEAIKLINRSSSQILEKLNQSRQKN